MNPLRLFRTWARQWPDAAPWAVVLWSAVLLGGGVLGWSLWKNSRAKPTAAPSAPAAARATPTSVAEFEAVRAVRDRYPTAPELWLVAGRTLLAAGQPGARALLRDAAAARPADDLAILALLEACWLDGAQRDALAWHARLSPAARRNLLGVALGTWAGAAASAEEARALPLELTRNAATLLERHDDNLRVDTARSRLAAAAARPGPHRADVLRLLALTGRVPFEIATARAALAEHSGQFSDVLAAASLARAAPGSAPELPAALAALPPAMDADVPAYADWLAVQGRERDALAALDHASLAAPGRRAELLFALGENDAAQTHLRAGAWGRLPPEAVELAATAHRAALKNRTSLAEELWSLALRISSRPPNERATLLRLALALDDAVGTRVVFSALLADSPREVEVLRTRALWAARREIPARRADAIAAWRAVEPGAVELWLGEGGVR